MARIVFDLDGTLIDSALDLHHIACEIIADEGRQPITVDQARSYIGNGVDVFVKKLRAAVQIPDNDHERILDKFKERYQEAVHLTLVYPGVKQALNKLLQAGHNLGVCTNKPMAPCLAVLKHLDLDGYFKVVRAGDSLPLHKPDPAPLHSAYAGMPPGQEFYVGDSEVDAETAMRARVPFLLYTEGYRKKSVDLIEHTQSFSHFDRLPSLIDELLTEMGDIRTA